MSVWREMLRKRAARDTLPSHRSSACRSTSRSSSSSGTPDGGRETRSSPPSSETSIWGLELEDEGAGGRGDEGAGRGGAMTPEVLGAETGPEKDWADTGEAEMGPG